MHKTRTHCAHCTHALCTVHALPADIIDANKTYISGLISMLPLIGVASYVKYDGFCYIDYRDVTHCVLWLLIMVPCVCSVLLLYVQIYKRSGLSKTVRFGLLGFWFLFLCGWVLGIPTCLHI